MLKRTAAALLWLMAALPLNLLVLSAFARQARRPPRPGPKRPPAAGDDQRILRFVKDNLVYIEGRRGDEGLGTRYERLMVDRLLVGLARENSVSRVLESPADGITGVPGANSLALAEVLGLPVLLCSPSPLLLDKARQIWRKRGLEGRVRTLRSRVAGIPLPAGSVDLAWSFCMLEKMEDPASYLGEMARVSSNLVLAVVINGANPGNALHRRYHAATGGEWDHGRLEIWSARSLEGAFRQAGLRVLETGEVDAPPSWDTQDMPLKDDIQRLAGLLGADWEWGLESRRGDSGALGFIIWLEENLPRWLKRRAAHHLYVLGTTRRG
jgi:SAM-dependent methyltransferase